MALEAQLKPNDKLLWLNDQGEKLFSSIEITPNFASSGKAYLTGLAVTDSPASLGTQELYFSSKTSKAAFFATPVELSGLREPEPEAELNKFATVLARFFKRFAVDEQQASPSTDTPTESKPPMDEATAKALQALVEQQLIVTAGIQAVIDSFAEATPEPDQTPIDDVQAAVDEIVTVAEEEKNLSRKGNSNQAVLAGMAKLEKQFSALLNTTKGRDLQRTTGAADQKKARVL